MSEKKGIGILGSTGSIGTQALDVIREFSDKFSVELLVAGSNYKLLIDQATEFKPNTVVIANDEHYEAVFDALDPHDIKVYAGVSATNDCVQMDSIDVLLTAVVGFAGLQPTIKAIEAGKHIALANKETLVVAGEIITRMAKENNVAILPVDSEHSAIFQCMVGEFNKVEKVILTASGGPFRGKSAHELAAVTSEQALAHPNWSMGAKITIDSATLMNKGLEVIEAKWLFGVGADNIEVVVHPQSIVHSMVQFEDGSIKAQLGFPDMKLPILYALSFPERYKSSFARFDFTACGDLTFEKPDLETFSNLPIAYDALRKGGNAPCALNAANEIAVQAFLDQKIGFLDIARINEHCLQEHRHVKSATINELIETDREARQLAVNQI